MELLGAAVGARNTGSSLRRNVSHGNRHEGETREQTVTAAGGMGGGLPPPILDPKNIFKLMLFTAKNAENKVGGKTGELGQGRTAFRVELPLPKPHT